MKKYFQHRSTLFPSPSRIASLNSNSINPRVSVSLAYSSTPSLEGQVGFDASKYRPCLQERSHSLEAPPKVPVRLASNHMDLAMFTIMRIIIINIPLLILKPCSLSIGVQYDGIHQLTSTADQGHVQLSA